MQIKLAFVSASAFAVLSIVACKGGGGSTTGVTSGTLACVQKSGSDTSSSCEGRAGKPRKLDCPTAQDIQAALSAGCELEKSGDEDVCCPTTVFGTPPSSSSSTSGEVSSSSSTSSGSTSSSSGSTTSSSGSTTSTSGSTGGGCSGDLAGTWGLSGTCNESECEVSQNGCNLSVSCLNGTSLSGTVTGSSATLSGQSNGANLTCSLVFSGSDSFSMSCGSVCTGSGTRL